ncbi:hypothetical protein QBC35DRAFT_529392 [Podospora australis]|uniref:Tat pathway signal sequence n=1 Tax=Podospora australis TaxID=1536484 RepID=A0AAN7AM13_9PEZI|nr:hypothetical protein QBC35DRAFT_529392 [Podospora australis]
MPSEKRSYQRIHAEDRSSQSSDDDLTYDPNENLLGGKVIGKVRKDFFPRLRSCFRLGGIALAIINTVLLVVIAAMTSAGHAPSILCKQESKCSEVECAAMTSFYSPLLEPDANAIEYEDVLFRGALHHTNIYKGKPNKKMDEAWAILTHLNSSMVPREAVERVHKSPNAVHYSKEEGGQYMIGVEVFHQMHCLNLLRMYTYREYYDLPENRPVEFTDPEDILRHHVDHCIDMLRQTLACQGDVGIITSNWVRGYTQYPDFSTWHKCRKLDKIVNWLDKHSLPHNPEVNEESVWYDEPPVPLYT